MLELGEKRNLQISSKTLFMAPTDAHYYKIVEMFKHLKL
jgi:hypothetical protein